MFVREYLEPSHAQRISEILRFLVNYSDNFIANVSFRVFPTIAFITNYLMPKVIYTLNTCTGALEVFREPDE